MALLKKKKKMKMVRREGDAVAEMHAEGAREADCKERKNAKRDWETNQALGSITEGCDVNLCSFLLSAEPGKECYLVQPDIEVGGDVRKAGTAAALKHSDEVRSVVVGDGKKK